MAWPLPDRSQQPRHQFDQTAGLLELLVLLEQRDDVLEPRVEGIGRGNLVGDGLGATVGRLGLGGLFQLAAERLSDVFDLSLVGQGLEQPLAQDVVNLVGGKIDRRDVAFLAAEFCACVFQRPVDQLGTRVVGRREVGNDDADVLLLARRREQIGKGPRGDVGDGAVADLLRVEVVEVRRHLIEQNENRLIAIEELEPVLLIRGLGAACPERLELVALAELIGDLAPEEVVWIVAAVEGSDVWRLLKAEACGIPAQ